MERELGQFEELRLPAAARDGEREPAAGADDSGYDPVEAGKRAAAKQAGHRADPNSIAWR